MFFLRIYLVVFRKLRIFAAEKETAIRIIKHTINFTIMKHLRQTICLVGLAVLFLAQVPLCVKGEELPPPLTE